MYANLRIKPSADAELRPDAIGKRTLKSMPQATSADEVGVFFAHEVEVLPDGRVRVHLDANDGEGSYAEPAGIVVVTGGLTITADF